MKQTLVVSRNKPAFRDFVHGARDGTRTYVYLDGPWSVMGREFDSVMFLDGWRLRSDVEQVMQMWVAIRTGRLFWKSVKMRRISEIALGSPV